MKKYFKSLTVTVLFLVLVFTSKTTYANVEEIKTTSEQTMHTTNTDTVKTNINDKKVEDKILDSTIYNSGYKFSDGKDITLPFFKLAMERIIVDRDVEKSGFIVSYKSVDVNNELKGIHGIFSNETLRLNAKTEYTFAYANDAIVSKDILKSTYILAKNLTIEKEVNVGEDVVFSGVKLLVKGNVLGNVLGYANEVYIEGNISGDLRINTDKLVISDNANISGRIYIETTNKDLKVDERFENQRVLLMDKVNVSKSATDIVIDGVITAAIFALVYMLINKISKGKVFENIVSKTKKYTAYTVLMGAINLILIPFIYLLLILLSITKLYIVTVPLIFVYTSYLFVALMLSTFVVGSFIFKYMSTKYSNIYDKKGIKFAGSFFIFLVLYILCRVPVIGGYISMFIVIVSIGMIFTLMTKKFKNSDIEVVKIEEK